MVRRSISVTFTKLNFKSWAAERPPNPPPTITTLHASLIDPLTRPRTPIQEASAWPNEFQGKPGEGQPKEDAAERSTTFKKVQRNSFVSVLTASDGISSLKPTSFHNPFVSSEIRLEPYVLSVFRKGVSAISRSRGGYSCGSRRSEVYSVSVDFLEGIAG